MIISKRNIRAREIVSSILSNPKEQVAYVFENFLESYWAEHIAEGVLDDDMPDAYEAFLEELGSEDFLGFGNLCTEAVVHYFTNK